MTVGPLFPKITINSLTSSDDINYQQKCQQILSVLIDHPENHTMENIQIASQLDCHTARLSYDADFYDNINDGKLNYLTTENPSQASLDNIANKDIQYFIDNMKTPHDSTAIKQFTTKDLNNHISNHWRPQIRVQMDSGASDNITNDKNLLSHYKNVKSRHINTANHCFPYLYCC